MKYIAIIMLVIGSFIIGTTLGRTQDLPKYCADCEMLLVNGVCRNTDNIAPWVK